MCSREGEEADLGSGLEVFLSTRRLVEFKHKMTVSASSWASPSAELAWLSVFDSLTIGHS